MRNLILALVTLSFGYSWAYLPPDLSLRRTQLVQLLPYAAVHQLQTWVKQQPVTLSPAQYLERLLAHFPDKSLAWTFYASWEYLNLLEQTQQSYGVREQDLEKSRQLLTAYLQRCEQVLQGNPPPDKPSLLHLDAPGSQPLIEEHRSYLKIFRSLPWPEQGYTQAQVLELSGAAQADLQQVYRQQSRIEAAKNNFIQHQNTWTNWLNDLAIASQYFSQTQYLEPYNQQLPLPPKESLNEVLNQEP